MKAFFGKLKNWWSRHKPTKRRLIQLYAFLLYNANIKGFIKGEIYQGNTKYLCVPGLNCYSCPGAIGACPLGALQNALASSGTKAPYYVIGIILLLGLILGRTVCGFLCPIGLGQELLYKIKTPKLKKSRVTRILSYLKYVILVVFVIAIPVMYSLQLTPVPGFCKYICPSGTFLGAIGLLLNPANESYFSMLGPLFTWKFCLLIAICVASVFIFRVFCRFVCPLGALYGFFNKIALLGVKLDKNKCTDCGLCVAHCKMDIKHVGDHECIDCGECIDICPAKAISWKGSKLFLHRNAVEAIQTPAEDVKPLAVVLENGSAVANESVLVVPPSQGAVSEAQAEEVAAESEIAVTTEKKKGRGRAFWLQFAAWAVALCVLVGALVYYNFIDDDGKTVTTGNQVGDLCPDFTVPLYGDSGEYSVEDSRGKVTIVNFWATWCGPCVTELPYFEKFYHDYSDNVSIVAVCTADTADVPAFMNAKGWDEYSIMFAQDDSNSSLYYNLGGKGSLPMTVILNQDGFIVYNRAGSVTYELLLSYVEPLLAE